MIEGERCCLFISNSKLCIAIGKDVKKAPLSFCGGIEETPRNAISNRESRKQKYKSTMLRYSCEPDLLRHFLIHVITKHVLHGTTLDAIATNVFGSLDALHRVAADLRHLLVANLIPDVL